MTDTDNQVGTYTQEVWDKITKDPNAFFAHCQRLEKSAGQLTRLINQGMGSNLEVRIKSFPNEHQMKECTAEQQNLYRRCKHDAETDTYWLPLTKDVLAIFTKALAQDIKTFRPIQKACQMQGERNDLSDRSKFGLIVPGTVNFLKQDFGPFWMKEDPNVTKPHYIDVTARVQELLGQITNPKSPMYRASTSLLLQDLLKIYIRKHSLAHPEAVLRSAIQADKVVVDYFGKYIGKQEASEEQEEKVAAIMKEFGITKYKTPKDFKAACQKIGEMSGKHNMHNMTQLSAYSKEVLDNTFGYVNIRSMVGSAMDFNQDVGGEHQKVLTELQEIVHVTDKYNKRSDNAAKAKAAKEAKAAEAPEEKPKRTARK